MTKAHEAHPVGIHRKELRVGDDDEAVLCAREADIHALRLSNYTFANIDVAIEEAFAGTGGAKNDEASLETLKRLAGTNVDVPKILIAAEFAE